MEVNNIISWVGNQLEEAQRFEPAWQDNSGGQAGPSWQPPDLDSSHTGKSPLTENLVPNPPNWQITTTNPPPLVTTTTTTTTTTKGCNRQCSRIFLQVCGSNGRTYNNKCLLELDACESNTTIQVVKEGSCITSITTTTTTTTTQPPFIQPDKDTTTPENTFGVVVCKRTEFTCSLDETCISYFKRCDGKPDCSDGQARMIRTRVITQLCFTRCSIVLSHFFQLQDEQYCDGDCSLTDFRSLKNNQIKENYMTCNTFKDITQMQRWSLYRLLPTL